MVIPFSGFVSDKQKDATNAATPHHSLTLRGITYWTVHSLSNLKFSVRL